MKIAKINEKEYVLKFNIGVLRRVSKKLKLTTPEIFDKLTENDMDVVLELLYECIVNTHKDFDFNILDELQIYEFNELVVILAEVISEGMPETQKKTKKKK